MPRKKKTAIAEEKNNKTEEFVYCGLWKCPHEFCLRHHVNQPWNEIIHVRKFTPDKEWNCKDMEV